ncbi:MAG: DUF3333 domain-containing protein, partial [Alphaproteobacteria bacterium]
MAELSDQKAIHTGPEAERRLRRRYGREARFKAYGIAAILVALAALGWLLFTMVSNGLTVFRQHFLTIEVELKEELIDPEGTRDMAEIRRRDYKPLLFDAIAERLPETQEIYDRIDRVYRFNRTRAEEMRLVAEEKAAGRRKLTDELLQLVDRDRALEILREQVLDDTDLVGTVQPVLLPASPRLARFARSEGAADAGLT